MWVNKKMKLILLVVFTFGVSLGAPNATTQSNPPSQYNDVLTAVSTTGNHVTTTFGTDLLTSPKYPSSSNSGSSPFGQNGNRDTSITTPASSKTTTREMLRETTPCVRNSSANSKTKLVIGGFYSDGSGEWDGSGLREAVDLALRHVNEDPNILKKYDLDIEWKDTRCEAADGVWSFHSHLVEEPKKVMLLGPPCSPDAEPVAQTSERGNLVTVSYSAASPALSDRETHPYFFRTYKTDVIQNAPKVWLFNHFNWRRIGSIHQKRDLFTLTHNHLFDFLKVANIKVNVKEIFDKTPKTHQMAVMKDEDIKIILVGGYEESARELFCTAYKEGLHGPDYVWILPGWYNYHWYHNASSNCTEEEVVMTVEESLYISMEAANFSETPNNATVAGYTANEIKTQLEENWNKNANVTGLEMFGYDALWAIALALNQTEEVLAKEQYQDGCLENFNYNANDPKAKRMGYLLFKKMNATSFEGASGHVDLSHGDRHGLVNIEQLQPSCDKGWHLNNTSCYKFVKEKRNWIDSRQFCRDLAPERSSHLVSILSLSELSFLKGKTKGGSWYIGLTYDNFSDKLVWVDTKILGQKEWWPPSFDSAKETGSCYGWTVGSETWKPSDCSEEKKFICKRRADFEEKVVVTLFSNESGASDVKLKGNFVWHDGIQPRDRTQAEEVGLQQDAYIVLSACACLGIILAISFLIFNISARKHRILKISSPNMNNLIVIGCILIYLSICILGMEVVEPKKNRKPVRAFCMLRLWLVSLGFVLGFGAIFCKIWRVYKVANFKNFPKRVVIKDSKLFGIVGILLLPDVLLLSVWTTTDPLTHTAEYIDLYSYVRQCNCKFFNVWAIILCAYKGLILVIGVFLSWETRNVKIAALNDSKSIGLCIYTTTLMCVIGIASAFTFPRVPGYQYLVTSTCMLFCTTFVLLVVFVPKIRRVLKRSSSNRGSSSTSMHCVSTRIQATPEARVDVWDSGNNNNATDGSLSSLKLFSCSWKQSHNVKQPETATNHCTRNMAYSEDHVFD